VTDPITGFDILRKICYKKVK